MSEQIDVVPQPVLPERLPFGMTPETVLEWRARLDALPDDEARIRAVRDELRTARALAEYLVGCRAYFCGRWYLIGATVRAIALAAGVSDTYVSRRVRRFGLEPRRTRQGTARK